MPYEKAKIYFDGSHYIAIPQNEGKSPGKGGYRGNENDEMRTAFEKAYKGAKAKRRKEKVTEIVAELKPQFENEGQKLPLPLLHSLLRTLSFTSLLCTCPIFGLIY